MSCTLTWRQVLYSYIYPVPTLFHEANAGLTLLHEAKVGLTLLHGGKTTPSSPDNLSCSQTWVASWGGTTLDGNFVHIKAK